MARTKTTYRTIHPETNEEVTFTKGGRPIRWITWGDLGKGLVHFGYSSQETYEKAVKAPRSSNPYAKRYEATAATVVEDETPTAKAPTVEPVATEEPQQRPMRAGLTTVQDSPSPMNHTVKLDGQMIGVIIDESAAKLSRGAFAAWSSKCPNRGGIVGFYPTKEDAAEAIADLYAEVGPGGSKAPGFAKRRARFLALPTVRRDAVARRAARLYDGTRTVTACWTAALEWDEGEHPGADPETGEPVYVRTHSATSRHLPNPDKVGRRTLCGQEWQLASWYRHPGTGQIQRPENWMIRDLPDCGGCDRSHAARQARAAA
ncbi:hypothetical protein ACWCY6_17885 [Streptomyces sp. 900105755]|uniref:hypothetical protein n=1 Tax=Streptomyces sp. NPDC050121 TaxID=3365601 RepID=UPI0037A903A6